MLERFAAFIDTRRNGLWRSLRMLPEKVLAEFGWICGVCTRLRCRNSRRAYGGARLYACMPACGKIVRHIAFLYEGHGNSSRSAACLSGTRLERSLECRRREGETLTTTSSLRAFELACRRNRNPHIAHKQCRACHNERSGKEKTALQNYFASGPSCWSI
jgi:hypothetical protein